jgi:LysR family transcriptional regulator (chromosome initiation inhibitor)
MFDGAGRARSALDRRGRLFELAPQRRIAVKLYWQRTRLAARLLDRLTQAVRWVAAEVLQSDAKAPAGPEAAEGARRKNELDP